MQALSEKGAGVDAVDKKGRTALGCAIKHGREECALWLLEEAGASWHATFPSDVGGRLSMLELAAECGCPRVVKSLLRRMCAEADNTAGAEEEGIWEAMQRAAGRAAFRGSLASLKALVEEDLDMKAARVMHEVPQELLDDGVDVRDGSEDGEDLLAVVRYGLLTPAAHGGQQGVVEFLIEEGYNPYGGDDDCGMLPHVMAAMHGYTSLLE